MQQQALDEYHAKEKSQLEAQRRKEEQEAARQFREEEQARLEERRRIYELARNDLTLSQGMDQAKLKAEWKQYTQDRLAVKTESDRAQIPANDHDQSAETTSSEAPETQADPIKPEFDEAASSSSEQIADDESQRIDAYLENRDQQHGQDQGHSNDNDRE